jgi:cell division protease FtsH
MKAPLPFPILPVGTAVGAYSSGQLIECRDEYQILEAGKEAYILTGRATSAWVKCPANDPVLVALRDQGESLRIQSLEGEAICILCPASEPPCRLADWPRRHGPTTSQEFATIVEEILSLEQRSDDACWSNAVYLAHEPALIEMGGIEGVAEKRELLSRIVTGGVAARTFDRMREINRGIEIDQIKDAFERVGLRGISSRSMVKKGQFSVPGRQRLAVLFQDHVIDYYANREKYEALGYSPPNGILLYGPPGTGKTYAVRALATYLDWSTYEANLSSIGSKYIHETGKQLKAKFDEAADNSPSILIMDEVDAMTMERHGTDGAHKVEELSELLRLVENAASEGVLVVATTNRRDAIDDAFLRKGRFDLQLEVTYPDEGETLEVLNYLFSEKPLAEGVDLLRVARNLSGRPMSDLAWLANEAARISGSSGKEVVDELSIAAAAKALNASL